MVDFRGTQCATHHHIPRLAVHNFKVFILSDLILRQLDEGSESRKVLIILTDDELRTHSLKNGLGLPIFSPAEIGKVSHYFQSDDENLVSDWMTPT